MQSLRLSKASGALRDACTQRLPAAVQHGRPRRLLPPSTTERARAIGTSSSLPVTRNRLRQPALASASSSPAPAPARHASSSAAPGSETLQKTGLYDLHLAHGAKMVPFGGFHMPVQYSALSVSQSHVFTRTQASIFDVGHMVQRIFDGPGAAAFLQRVTPSNLESLGAHRSTLSCLLHADGSGGIVDDTVVTKLGDGSFYVVTNAACRDKDDAFLGAELAKWNAEADHADLQAVQSQLDGWGLVALQGPGAEALLREVLADPAELELKGLFFGQSAYAKLKLPGGGARVSAPVLVSRGGYTGEDGFEISIPADDTVAVTEALLSAGPERVQLAGLGARDSLRLEAGMCLYGHDLDDSTTPVEGGLSWIIPKERRSADAGFHGAAHIARQLVPRSKGGLGVQTRRVGLIVEGAPAREGAQIVDGDEAAIGRVTSGCPSPTLGKNIAMGYVKDGMHKAGTEVAVLVRGKKRKAVVAKMPFVPTNYWKGA